jgi:tRNA (cytidine/uridine-2'-O-)-methyltransferase
MRQLSPKWSQNAVVRRAAPGRQMFNVLLFEPEIPPNTGNSIRLCANTGAHLHLVGRLGFDLSAPQLRRAGLDYHDLARVSVHADLDACLAAIGPTRLFVIETNGARGYQQASHRPGDSFLFGRETSGLPDSVAAGLPPHERLHIPMRPSNRSLNLSNAVAVVVYEAWRQNGFRDAPSAAAIVG